MPDYRDGKIYAIHCLTSGEQYIGSTTRSTLALRLSQHKSQYTQNCKGSKVHKLTSHKIIETGNYRIELIEAYPCESKDELHAREGHYIRTLECVNKVVPGRTKAEYCADNKTVIAERQKQYYVDNKADIIVQKKQYYADNKADILKYEKQYYVDNKTAINKRKKQFYADNKADISEKGKQYYADNKDRCRHKHAEYQAANKTAIREKAKQYYAANADIIATKNRFRVTCECGCVMARGSLAVHIKSKKHQTLLDQLSDEPIPLLALAHDI